MEAGQCAVLFVHLPFQRFGQFGAVYCLDDVEEADGVLGLVGLQVADKVEFEVRIFYTQGGEFFLRFLHSVFTEYAMSACSSSASIFSTG